MPIYEDDDAVHATFSEHLRQFPSLPVLFVGSGISMRYLGTPRWAELLQHFAEKTLGRSLNYYQGRTAAGLPGVATEIASDLYDRWWDDAGYAESVKKWGPEVRRNSDPLKIEIARYIGSFVPNTSRPEATELSALKSARVHCVVTTNWDNLIEGILPDFTVFTGQEEILFAETQGIGEIYKIHGSIDRPTSLVLTAEDYSDYYERNPYLIAKILTLFAEHPILFLGYSLTDTHIQRILRDLLACLDEHHVEQLNERLIFIRRRKGGEPAYRTAPMLLEGNTLLVTECLVNDFEGVYGVLRDLPPRFPVRILRQLKKEIYELARAEPPRGRIYVTDIDDDTRLDEVDVVIGVGTRDQLGAKGYQAIERRDLVLMMLREEVWDGSLIIRHVLPRVMRQAKYAPVFYPLRLAGRVPGEQLNVDDLPARARALASGERKLRPYSAVPPEARSIPFSKVATDHSDRVLDYGLVCQYSSEEEVGLLREFLLERFESRRYPSTELYKLACQYDSLAYGPDPTKPS